MEIGLDLCTSEEGALMVAVSGTSGEHTEDDCPFICKRLCKGIPGKLFKLHERSRDAHLYNNPGFKLIYSPRGSLPAAKPRGN